jgi:hypothetical protein
MDCPGWYLSAKCWDEIEAKILKIFAKCADLGLAAYEIRMLRLRGQESTRSVTEYDEHNGGVDHDV